LILPGQPLVIGEGVAQPAALAAVNGSRSIASEAPVVKTPVVPVAPLPAVKTVPALVPAQEPEEEISHKLTLSAGYAMTTLSAADSSGTTASLFSAHDLLLNAAWKQEWSESFSTSFNAKIRSVNFQPSTSSTKTISGTSQTTPGLSFVAEQRLLKPLALSYGVSYDNRLFLHGTNTSQVTVDAVPVPSAAVGLNFEGIKKGKTSAGVTGSFEYLFPAKTDSYLVKSGTAARAGLYVRRTFQENYAEIALGYENRSQNTSLVTLKEQSILGTLTFSLPLFEGSKK
jgi:hypothetical protein